MAEAEDLYEILQVHPSAHPEVIQAAYRRLALLYHPDRNRSPEAARLMARLNRAYDVLRNPEKRAAYDRNREAQGNTTGAQPGSESAGSNAPGRRTSRRTRQRRSDQSSPDYFTLGSHKNDVTWIQGQPRNIDRSERFREEFWIYRGLRDIVYVAFNLADQVEAWDNTNGGLKVRMVPGPNTTSSPFFSVGSHKDDVARLQGTPFRISPPSRINREVWFFHGGIVEFFLWPAVSSHGRTMTAPLKSRVGVPRPEVQ